MYSYKYIQVKKTCRPIPLTLIFSISKKEGIGEARNWMKIMYWKDFQQMGWEPLNYCLGDWSTYLDLLLAICDPDMLLITKN